MTEKPPARLSPGLLAIVGVLVVAAVVVGIVVVKKPAKAPESADSASAQGTRAKSPRGSAYYPERSTGLSKAKAAREGTRPEPRGIARRGGEEIEEMFTRVSVEAREELQQLRAKHATVYDDPQERQAFGVRLSQITDPQERQRLLRERTEEMRRARAAADAAKSAEDREREKELIALIQVQNLWRMADFVGKNPELQPEAEAFDERLAQWLEDSETMDSATFHSTFSALRDTLNQLRARNSNSTSSGATPANVSSQR